MAVDKVKPLKMEDTTDGTEYDVGPTEVNPNEDYVTAKGLALENSDNHRVEKVDNEVAFDDPVNNQKKVSDLITKVQKDDVDVTNPAKVINFEGGVTVTDEGNGKATINIEGGGTASGAIHQMFFVVDSSGNNKWMENIGDNNVPSNSTPGIMIWKSKLVGISFSNKNGSVDTDVEIYSVSEGDGSSPKILEFLWELRNVRIAKKTNFAPDIVFEAGDKVMIYLKDRGTNPHSVVVSLYFQVIEFTSEESSENYYSHGGCGGSSTS